MRPIVLAAGLLASPAAFAFPITLSGQICDTVFGICAPTTVELQGGGRATLTVDLLGTVMSSPIQWRYTPATRTVDFRLSGYILSGTVAGSCGQGAGTVPTPPSLVPLYGSTMDVVWSLCR